MVITEKELIEASEAHFKRNGYQYAFEVPLHSKLIDFAALTKRNELVGIEFKLHNWKRAVDQAYANANAFDFIYVCLPEKTVNENLLNYAKEKGVGVMLFFEEDDSVKVKQRAKRIKMQWQPNVSSIRNYLINGKQNED